MTTASAPRDFAFDLIKLDIRSAPVEDRKVALAEFLRNAPGRA